MSAHLVGVEYPSAMAPLPVVGLSNSPHSQRTWFRWRHNKGEVNFLTGSL